MSVDRDHRTGTIRGLLCADCNEGIARFEDPARLRDAGKYLESDLT